MAAAPAKPTHPSHFIEPEAQHLLDAAEAPQPGNQKPMVETMNAPHSLHTPQERCNMDPFTTILAGGLVVMTAHHAPAPARRREDHVDGHSLPRMIVEQFPDFHLDEVEGFDSNGRLNERVATVEHDVCYAIEIDDIDDIDDMFQLLREIDKFDQQHPTDFPRNLHVFDPNERLAPSKRNEVLELGAFINDMSLDEFLNCLGHA